MIEELTKDPYNITSQTEDHIKKTVNFFLDYNFLGNVLDVGQKSPLAERLEQVFSIKIDNTSGDLDEYFDIPKERYQTIIYSHTIEHQFNPLNTLLILKEVMDKNSTLFIILPDRGKLLWCDGHFHEIDTYRMGLLLKRAGMKIGKKTKQKVWRNWKSYIKGFRPIYRLFREFNAIYEVKLIKKVNT